jgi:hypothetical protein
LLYVAEAAHAVAPGVCDDVREDEGESPPQETKEYNKPHSDLYNIQSTKHAPGYLEEGQQKQKQDQKVKNLLGHELPVVVLNLKKVNQLIFLEQ